MTLHLLDDKTAPKSQRFRWQLKAKNGKIVAASSEGFSTARDCATNAWRTSVCLTKAKWNGAIWFEGRDPVKVRQ